MRSALERRFEILVVICERGKKVVNLATEFNISERSYTSEVITLTYTCTVCRDSYVDNYVSANDHTASEWITDRNRRRSPT